MRRYNMDSKRYFSVECKCGHTGSRMYYIPIKFAIIASNAREAAKLGRWKSRVKHHHKDCVLGVDELSEEEYYMLLLDNKRDPFLNCQSIQEQKCFDFEDRKVYDPHYFSENNWKHKEDYQKHPNYIGKTLIRNPKKYMKNYYYEEAWA